ncbi:MAG: hypothetical protein R6V28_13940 [Nitriliruptoraceae bacterium]
MRRGRGEWVKLSALASLMAFGALLAMTFVVRLVQGMVWEGGVDDPTALQQVAILSLAGVFLAAPGLLVGWTAGARGWWLGAIALASALLGLGVGLLSAGAPVATWAGTVAGTLLGVVWAPVTGIVPAPSVRGERDRGSEKASAATGVSAGELVVLLDPPQRRLVPRDVLAPPEGWEVPNALPPRPSRCELERRVHESDGRSSQDRRRPAGSRGEQSSSS